MSVSMLIEHENEDSRLIPIATEQTFKDYWLPISAKLNLIWIPLFQTGLSLGKDDREDVLAELSRFETYLIQEAPNYLRKEIIEHISARVSNLKMEMSHLRDDATVYF
jgi:hypothetical protein